MSLALSQHILPQIFTCLALWADSVSKLQYPDVMCVSMPSLKPRFPVIWIILVKEHIANIGIPLDNFGFKLFQFLRVLKLQFF